MKNITIVIKTFQLLKIRPRIYRYKFNSDISFLATLIKLYRIRHYSPRGETPRSTGGKYSLLKPTSLIRTDDAAFFAFDQQGAAFRAGFAGRFAPIGLFAFGIVGTGIEDTETAALGD